MTLKTITVTLEAVTPLFMGGADPRGLPEVRPPSFRGVLRYWLRAALGGVLGGHIEKVREEEGKVFGSAGEKDATASAVWLRVEADRPDAKLYSEIIEKQEEFVGGTKRTSVRWPGVAYLYFSGREDKKSNLPERQALQNPFTLEMAARPGAANGEQALERAYAALWLATHLGGFGNRARRGAGSLQAAEIEGDIGKLAAHLPLTSRAQSPRGLAEALGEGLRAIREHFAASNGPPRDPRSVPEFDILHPNWCHVWVVDQPYPTWQEALNTFGLAMQAFRKDLTPRYRDVKRARDFAEDFDIAAERATFGLPIPYYSKTDRKSITLVAEEHDRRASPLIVRVAQLRDNAYALVFTWFRSRFLPVGELIMPQAKWKTGRWEPPFDDVLEAFLTHAGFTLQEVRYG